jgi:hypothetical protein
MLDGTSAVDRGAVRPSARTMHQGGWNSAHNGLVVFGGEFDSDICDPEVRSFVSLYECKHAIYVCVCVCVYLCVCV